MQIVDDSHTEIPSDTATEKEVMSTMTMQEMMQKYAFSSLMNRRGKHSAARSERAKARINKRKAKR